jgi:pimeloyl-ACP methyl ester carboxylesterase
VLDAHEVDRAVVVGHSMGGPAAQRLSMRFPTVESYRDLHTGSDFAAPSGDVPAR